MSAGNAGAKPHPYPIAFCRVDSVVGVPGPDPHQLLATSFSGDGSAVVVGVDRFKYRTIALIYFG